MAGGRRIAKKGIKYYYDYEDRLISGNGLEYYYDNIGVAGFKYGGEYYTYKRDIQNNVIAILDSTGTAVVQYKYDAWGNHTVSGSNITLGNLNPFRYRSYYYDTETKLYFLQSRYYDPEVGRFLNMDSIDYADPETLNGLNLYVYCGNNPVMNVDPTGHIFFTCLLIGLIAGAAIGATVNGVKAYKEGARGWDLAGAIVTGALVGGAVGLAAGAVAGAGAAIIGAGMSAIGAGMSGGLALAGGGIFGSGALIAAGVGTVVAGGSILVSGVVGGLWALNVLFAQIGYHGEPNSTVGNGNSEGIYDENGNLIYRKDVGGRAHYIKGYGYAMPHTHGYVWKFIKGAWRIVSRFVLPF